MSVRGLWKAPFVRVDNRPRHVRLVFPSRRGNREFRLNVHGIHDRPFYTRERSEQNGTEAQCCSHRVSAENALCYYA
ncbi:hypothetical protein HN011_004211 [Eciton burchellii]|nr:hypothetical protein HN011_004211 [Eciton burchellii]